MTVSPAATPAPESDRSEPPADGDKPPRGLLHALHTASSFIGRMRWLILCLFQFGVIAGLFAAFQLGVHPPTPKPILTAKRSNKAPIVDPPDAPQPSEESIDQVLQHGDALIRQGRFELALAGFRAQAKPGGDATPAARYRIAICLEALARWDAAITEYNLIRSSGSEPLLEVAAQLGQIRVWMRTGQIDEAKELACDLLLRSGGPEFRDRPFLSETVLRVALLLAQEVMGLDKPEPHQPAAVAHVTEAFGLRQVVDWLAMVGPVDPSHGEGVAAGSVQVEPSRGTAEQMVVRGSLTQRPVMEVLQSLAAASGRQCLLTPLAQDAVAHRTVAVTVDSLPMSAVLVGITEPLNMLWEVADKAIHFCLESEVTRDSLAHYRYLYAERILTDAISRSGSHPLSAVAECELGNLEYWRGRYDAAAVRYEQLAAKAPRSVIIETNYNLGLALRRSGRLDAAREAFYRVVDGAPNHPLAALASILIGRMYMDEADYERAIPPLRRAAALAAGTEAVPVSVLLHAAALLLMDHPQAVTELLTEYRDIVTEPRYRNVAAFLSSYARMLKSESRRQAQREGRVLTWAIVGAGRDNLLGANGTLLMGHAYRELGLGEKAIELYEQALIDGTPPALEPEMRFEIAEHWLVAGNVREAIHGFTELADSKVVKWSRLARIRLAEIALQDGRVEDCLNYCRSLLEPRHSADVAAVLKLMGQAFERSGSPEKAAACFAGHIPDS